MLLIFKKRCCNREGSGRSCRHFKNRGLASFLWESLSSILRDTQSHTSESDGGGGIADTTVDVDVMVQTFLVICFWKTRELLIVYLKSAIFVKLNNRTITKL